MTRQKRLRKPTRPSATAGILGSKRYHPERSRSAAHNVPERRGPIPAPLQEAQPQGFVSDGTHTMAALPQRRPTSFRHVVIPSPTPQGSRARSAKQTSAQTNTNNEVTSNGGQKQRRASFGTYWRPRGLYRPRGRRRRMSVHLRLARYVHQGTNVPVA